MMNSIPSDADHGVLPSGQPWIRYSALKKRDADTDAAKAMLKRFGKFVAESHVEKGDDPMELSPQAEQILARAIVEYFGKRKNTPLMKGVSVTTIDDIAEHNAASIHKMNADPVRRSD